MADETTHHRRGEQPRCARVEQVPEVAPRQSAEQRYPDSVLSGGTHERRCNHSLSLHGGDKNPGRCRATGCWCPGFVEHDELAQAL
jgi:hypothetical protein